VNVVHNLRRRGRLILVNPSDAAGAMITLDEARLRHAEACLLNDPEARQLWARVVWRLLATETRYAWLQQPAGGHQATAADGERPEWTRRNQRASR
jgi:hypothetical protein